MPRDMSVLLLEMLILVFFPKNYGDIWQLPGWYPPGIKVFKILKKNRQFFFAGQHPNPKGITLLHKMTSEKGGGKKTQKSFCLETSVAMDVKTPPSYSLYIARC